MALYSIAMGRSQLEARGFEYSTETSRPKLRCEGLNSEFMRNLSQVSTMLQLGGGGLSSPKGVGWNGREVNDIGCSVWP